MSADVGHVAHEVEGIPRSDIAGDDGCVDQVDRSRGDSLEARPRSSEIHQEPANLLHLRIMKQVWASPRCFNGSRRRYRRRRLGG